MTTSEVTGAFCFLFLTFLFGLIVDFLLLLLILFCKVAREFNDSIRGKKPEKCKVIVSSHNYQYTPSVEDLSNLVARIQASGADIVKFATTALDITDVARVFQITVHSQVSHVCWILFFIFKLGL